MKFSDLTAALFRLIIKDKEMSLAYRNKSYWELVGLNEAASPDTAAMSAIHPDYVTFVPKE